MPVLMKVLLLQLCLLLPLCPAQLQPAEEERQCVANPTGRVELSVDVLGTPGPEGLPGEKGERGDIGPRAVNGEKGLKGQRGYEGPRGPIGVPGLPGVIGPRGPPGDTELTGEEFSHLAENVSSEVLGQVLKKVEELEARLEAIEQNGTGHAQISQSMCGIFSSNWRRVAYIDTTQCSGQCPSGLVEHFNSTSNQRACGRSINEGCSSVTYPTGGCYTNICGQVRGYQFYTTNAFEALREKSINDPYVDGISITRGSPRQHVWTYASWWYKQSTGVNPSVCPCGRSDPNDHSGVPSFVGKDYYCETAFATSSESKRIAWENPLWDGAGSTCGNEGRCCATFGWFHKTVSPSTSDNIEVRWCADQERDNEDVLTDLVEIWVM